MAVMKAASFVLLLLVAVPFVYGADIIVGGNSGWSQSFAYDPWAASKTFRVGDNLLFNYAGNHGVDEVNAANYQACSSSNAINSHTGGSTTIPLTETGTRYFICPTVGHCPSGMKLQINVVAANSTPGATPSPPSSTTPPPSPPSPSAAAALFMDIKGLMFGVSLAYLAATLFLL